MKIPVAVIAATLALAPVGTAGWRPTGRGSGAAKSKTLPGATVAPTGPTAPVTNHAVTLTWPASTFQSGGAVPAYELKRYAFVTGAPQTVGSGCNNTVAGTTCTEAGVPAGTWQYTVTPAAGSWRPSGGESPKSAVVTVTP